MQMCALKKKKIPLGTPVPNMVYRDPTITANSFATLNEISQGRTIIGLGTGDGPVYSLGRTATKLVEFEQGLRVIRDLLHNRGIEVPKTRERASSSPAPAQDGSASASDREADPTRRARPGARSGVTGGTVEGAGRAGRVPPPPEVARGGVNPPYALLRAHRAELQRFARSH